MKLFIISFFVFLFSISLHAQDVNTSPSSKWKFGFDAGINYVLAITDDSFNQHQFVQRNGEAVHVGIVSKYAATDHISISPKVELSFHETTIEFFEGANYNYQIMPISMDLMVHFDYYFKTGSVSPFIYVGPNLKISLTPEPKNPTQFKTGNDFAIDLGIGMSLEKFGVSIVPNFRYSIGLLNVNEYPAVANINLRYIYFGINFMI